MGTFGVVIAGWAMGVAEGLLIASEILTASLRVAMIWRLAAPAFQDRFFANLAAPLVELVIAIRRAERLVVIAGRDG